MSRHDYGGEGCVEGHRLGLGEGFGSGCTSGIGSGGSEGCIWGVGEGLAKGYGGGAGENPRHERHSSVRHYLVEAGGYCE